MKEKNESRQENGMNRTRVKMTFTVLLLAILAVAELYLMMNDPKNYLFIGVVGLAILCFVYLLTDLSFRLQNEKEDLRKKEYESIYKAEKVSYVLMKQSFLDMERLLDRIKENSEVPTDELIQAQKAVGKVTIQRNKENALAIISSNDKLMDRLSMFERSINELTEHFEQSDDREEAARGRREITSALTGAQESISDELSTRMDRVEEQLQNVSELILGKIAELEEELEKKTFEMPTLQEATGELETEEFEVPGAIEEPKEFEISDTQAAADETEIGAFETPDTIDEPEEFEISDTQAAADEIITETFETPNEPETVAEPENTPESIFMPDIEGMPKIAEPPTESDKQQETEASLDDGKNMTPEEIASLLTEPQEEPDVTPEKSVPMPDLSDPGHVMTPEEIAALLANM